MLISQEEATKMELRGHVIVCLFAESNSPLIGLRNFVMPLRASNFHAKVRKKYEAEGHSNCTEKSCSQM